MDKAIIENAINSLMNVKTIDYQRALYNYNPGKLPDEIQREFYIIDEAIELLQHMLDGLNREME